MAKFGIIDNFRLAIPEGYSIFDIVMKQRYFVCNMKVIPARWKKAVILESNNVMFLESKIDELEHYWQIMWSEWYEGEMRILDQ